MHKYFDFGGGFRLIDIEARKGYFSGLQCFDQGNLVQDPATCGVNYSDSIFHQVELLVADDVIFLTRDVKGDKIRCFEDIFHSLGGEIKRYRPTIEKSKFYSSVVNIWIMINNFHADSQSHLGGRLADTSESNDTQGFASEFTAPCV